MATPNPNLIYRTEQSSSLTYTQLDGNFAYLSQSISDITSVESSSYAANADNALTSSYVNAANVDGQVANAANADNATTASYVSAANVDGYVSAANVDGQVAAAINADNALTASYIPTLNQDVVISGSILISGSIIPNTDGISLTSSFDLGSPTNAWKDIYVSNGTINFLDASGNVVQTMGTGNNSLEGDTTVNGNLYLNSTLPTNGAFIHGNDNIATGESSHAQGYYSIASGSWSHAEGGGGLYEGGRANGVGSHAEGAESVASGSYSHAEGFKSQALGYASHAEGRETIAAADYQHVAGKYNVSSSNTNDLFIIGNGTSNNNRKNILTVSTSSVTVSGSIFSPLFVVNGLTVISGSLRQGRNTLTGPGFDVISDWYAHAEGEGTWASNYYAHAEGSFTTASANHSHAEGSSTTSAGTYSHAEGLNTLTLSGYSHAEGFRTTSSGVSSHAEGRYSETYGNGSHAEGRYTIASGSDSHSEGSSSIAIGNASHAEGLGTIAAADYQHVAGRYNTPSSNPDDLFIIGNGVDNDNRQNALIVKMSGSITLPTTQSTSPSWTGTDGEIVPATVGGQHFLYMWMSGAWRSGSFV